MLGLRVLDWPVREAGDGSGRRIDCERKKGTRERERGGGAHAARMEGSKGAKEVIEAVVSP